MIRQATIQDLPAIAHVHSICFPDSYSSQLSRYKTVIGGGEFVDLLLFRVYERQSRAVRGGG